MGLSFNGYILEKPRVGSANSPFTSSPDNVISDQGDYDAVFGSDETDPGRCDYMVLALDDGDLPDATFGWTKNEAGVLRFDYDGASDGFRPLPGSTRQLVGTLASDSNTTRIQVAVPTASSVVSPYRISVGAISSGTTFTIVTVVTDASFTTPAAGSVQLSLETGNLNWRPSDLTAYDGQGVYYQRQSFFSRQESTGQLGVVGDSLVINPIPGTGQNPLIRFGFGLHLTPVERATEGAFSGNPAAGTVEWARSTGLLKFNSADLTANVGELVYYDGVLLASGLTLPRQTLGTVASPSNISGLPSEGGDLIFRAKNGSTVVRQFPITSRVENFAEGKAGTVQVDSSGAVQFSDSDVGKYGSRTAEVVFGDLLLERGLSMRFFRSPVDLEATDPDAKDVTSFVAVVDATLADPVLAAPQVNLPVLPIDDSSYPIVIAAEKGTGSFTGTLSRLDVSSPPAGLGYIINFDEGQLSYAQRKNNQLTAIPSRAAAVALPDTLVQGSNATFELNQGMGFAPLTQGVDAILDSTSGVLTFIDKTGQEVASGSSGSASAGTLTDLSADFVSSGVLAGDLVMVPAGPLAGVFTVSSVGTTALGVTPNFPGSGTVSYQVVRGKEVLADRFFQALVLVDPQMKVERLRALGTVTNSPRLSVEDPANTRVRLPSGVVVTPTVVATDANFTSQAIGNVQVSAETGNLNFSTSEPAGVATEVRKLTQSVDYLVNAELGFIQFTERMLALDEVWVTYASEDDPSTYTLERASFLVRKEVVEHPVTTSTMPFNPLGRTVAPTPAPAVFRGGRPQAANQTSVSTSLSTITFLPDILPTPGGALAVSDALPHGPVVEPSERVLVDYYVYEALGGENTITVLNPPIYLIQVTITDGETSFDVAGDWSTAIPANHLLRIGTEQVYFITSSIYDGTKTTVTVSQPFRDDFSDPKLFISSGPTPLTASGVVPAYFLLETAVYDTVPRGMNKFKLRGDLSSVYKAGTALYFSSGSVKEYYLVTGSKYDSDKDKTEVTLTQTSARQYGAPFTLRRSVRPIFEAGVTVVHTSEAPLVVSPAGSVQEAVTVFRQTSGSPGVILGPDDYKIDDSGKIELATSLQADEEVSALYTRYRFVNPGTLRSSYTSIIVPSADNGLLNQKLTANYTAYLPDSFYFRVETMSTYRSEVSEAYKDEAKSSAPSGGPRTSNASSPKLQEQGSASVFFEEGDLANEDIIARGTLKFYNDAINHLEDLLRNLDGRVVGDYDGKFKFDGTTGSTVSSFDDADNQIDDRVKLSDFPIDPTPPLFPLKFKGTYLKAYQASSDSRFYATFKNKFGYTVAGADTSAKTGDAILDFETKNLTGSSPTLFRRLPRALVTQSAKSGDTTVFVDTTAQVDTAPYRPAFANGMKVVIQNSSGSFIVSQGAALEIQSKTATSITFTAPLPGNVPIGASVYLADSDTVYRKSYRIGFDVTLDLEKGYALYVTPYPPFDGSVGGVPPELEVQTPDSEELLQASIFANSTSTTPYRFPALDGLALDDDGDQRLPLINPTVDRESGDPGYLETELRFVKSTTGVFDASTVSPFVGTGDIGGGGFTITLTSGTFPAPVPQAGDLVRTLSGLNGTSAFHRVTSVGPSSVTVDTAFTVDTAVSFLVTTADNLASGTLSTISGAVITDLLANFITAGVKRGHTVVRMEVGLGQYERRQVLSVDSATQITLTAPFSNVTFPALYRVHNPLNTFSDIEDLEAAPSGLLAILSTNPDSEIEAIDDFYASVLTDRLSPASASGSVTGTTLTGSGVDFIAEGVQVGDFVYITPTQTNQGFYLVSDVTGPTTLEVADPFPSAGSVNFRVVSSFGASEESLGALLDIRSQTSTFYTASTTWSSLVSTPVSVLVPPGVADATYFARGYTPADISTRRTAVNARIAYVPSAVDEVVAILSSSDRLYDKRYVWIDARINLEKGILVKQSRAVENRLKAQEETLKQLTKLQAVQ